MPRLIDADKLTAHKYSGVDFTKFADKGWHKSDEEIYAFKCGWNEALSMVSNHASTVDAEPVRHGRNLKSEYPSLFECSVCGWSDSDTYTGDTNKYNYCPFCGAKMDERREDG